MAAKMSEKEFVEAAEQSLFERDGNFWPGRCAHCGELAAENLPKQDGLPDHEYEARKASGKWSYLICTGGCGHMGWAHIEDGAADYRRLMIEEKMKKAIRIVKEAQQLAECQEDMRDLALDKGQELATEVDTLNLMLGRIF